jgi:hypothetical protein
MRPDQAARYGRQILLEGVGERGQDRVLAAVAAVGGEGLGHRVASLYAQRAGFSAIVPGPLPGDPPELMGHTAPAHVLAGSRAALAAFVAATKDDNG